MTGRVPNANRTVISPRKLRDYVLAPDHSSGGCKAVFFAQMGYGRDDWQRLEQDIRVQLLTHATRPGRLYNPTLPALLELTKTAAHAFYYCSMRCCHLLALILVLNFLVWLSARQARPLTHIRLT